MPRTPAAADAKSGAAYLYTVIGGALGLLLTLTSLLALAVRTGRILERTDVVISTMQRMEQDQAALLRERSLTIQEWSVWRRGTDDRLDHLELRPASLPSSSRPR